MRKDSCIFAGSEALSHTLSNMLNPRKMKTIRLIYPQWQGGIISHWIPEVEDPSLSSRGYCLGAQLLEFLAPRSNQETYTVPVDTGWHERKIVDGVIDRDAILRQTRAALDILDVAQPDRLVVLGGECSVSVAPFTYLAKKYAGDVAVLWLDSHPDITLPGDVYAGYHAMAVTACMGLGEEQIMSILPAKIDASRILFVGLREWERDEIKLRQKQFGIPHFTPQEVAASSAPVLGWLKASGASKVMVHFDMDVLDPAEIVTAVGPAPDGMKLQEVVRLINDVAAASDLVALTIAEPMPRTAIRIREMLHHLPLLQ